MSDLPPLAQVQQAAETLIRTCAKNGVSLTGFLFGKDPPIFMHFSNVRERGEDLVFLHLRLCATMMEKEHNNLAKDYVLDPEDEPDASGPDKV